MRVQWKTAVDWHQHLTVAKECAEAAAQRISDEFGHRHITGEKGPYDVQLRADLVSEDTIVSGIHQAYPDHRIISEEHTLKWLNDEHTWFVDPLDGTNNFGYGVAHCAVAITLFHRDEPVVAVVHDPVVKRRYYAQADAKQALRPAPLRSEPVPLRRASISYVTNYTPEARRYGLALERRLRDECKRVFTLWAPSLDLALISAGGLDAMVCVDANFLDVCAGLFLLEQNGGCVLGLGGERLPLTKSLADAPVSFVAARDGHLAQDLFQHVREAIHGV
ncbi:inositol monophosphatase family protein [Cryptosporangium phraense]|uniref:Inositol monophosphatase n=1 Tax=Cryptosporangium phraense TaxID=2593070 RepID=A0A545AET8_9ACTN|nr:inositol monophosphatase [Cryptosporangium phraense]TQS39842.1 inositol monophosphatase [Cryptosporangium phraense]